MLKYILFLIIIATNIFAQEWMMNTPDGAKIYVNEKGKGDTIIVLHGGWGAEHSYLIPAFENFYNDYHFVFYDQRGSLRSPCPDSLVTVDAHVDDLKQLIDALDCKNITIISHSMGGFLAMKFVEKYPGIIKKLILVSSLTISGNMKMYTEDLNDSALKRWERQDVIDTLKSHNLYKKDRKKMSDKEKGTWHRITFSAINLHDIKNWRKLKSAFFFRQGANVAAGESMGNEWDFTPILSQKDLLITFIHGDDDYLPVKYHTNLSKTMDVKIDLEIIQDAGHLIWIDNRNDFNEILSQILSK